MTLDIKKYLQNIINKECKISHFQGKIRVGKPQSLNGELKSTIFEKYGERFLDDADYIVVCQFVTERADDQQDDAEGVEIEVTKPATRDMKKKLFETVNRALGNAANNSNVADYKDITDTIVMTKITLKG